MSTELIIYRQEEYVENSGINEFRNLEHYSAEDMGREGGNVLGNIHVCDTSQLGNFGVGIGSELSNNNIKEFHNFIFFPVLIQHPKAKAHKVQLT